MAAAAKRLEDVMAFLTARGLSASAAALHDDLLSLQPSTDAAGDIGDRSCGDDGDGDGNVSDLELIVRHSLPSLRTPSSRHGGSGGDDDGAAAAATWRSSGSSSSDAFLSLGSSNSELFNPCANWSPARLPSEGSSTDRYSDFGTAREYDYYWYDERFAGYQSDSSSGHCHSEDKFILSVAADQRLGKQESYDLDAACHKNEHNELGGRCEDCAEIYASPFPLCYCCQGLTEKNSRRSNSTIYGRYQILDDQTERLDDYEMDDFQLKRIDAKLDVVIVEGAILQNPSRVEEEKSLVSGDSGPIKDELQMLNTYGFSLSENNSRGDFDKGKLLVVNKIDNEELQKELCNIQIFTESDFHQGADDPCRTGDSMTTKIENPGILDKEDDPEDEFKLYNHHEDEFEEFNLRIIHRKNRTGFEENRDFPIILNSVVAGRYYITEHLGSATFSKVVQARDLHTGVDVCLKIIKNDKDFFDQSLDEIKLLKLVNKYDPADEHHLLRLYDYFYHQEHLFIVTELLRANLYEFQKYNHESGCEEYYTLPRIQSIAQQCLEALQYLHHLRIIHCDLKPENILIKSYSRCEIKVIDLGSSCFETDNLCLYVQSRSYRSPEVILGLPYDHKIDIWSLGCILVELYTGDVLFPNDSVPMILARMIGILGPIDMEMLVLGLETKKYFTDNYDLYHENEETNQIEYLIPEKSSLSHHLQASDAGFLDFIMYLLQTNPRRRPTASKALQHPWLSFSYQ